MITRTIRKSMVRQEGQAMVLGALMLLILSIAVLTTVNLGHTIHERVRLQNNADAASYSMSAMEARAFNFYAFTNRTQVSHYVAAMVWQSTLSFLYSLEAFFTDAFGFVATAGICSSPSDARWIAICFAVETFIPYVSPFIRAFFDAIDAVKRTFEPFVRGLQQTLRAVDPDRWIGRYVIPGYRVLNMALAAASQATLYATLTHVTGTSSQVLETNDKNLNSAATRTVSGLLSACILQRAHFKESGVSALGSPNVIQPLDPTEVREDSKIARAKRSMGNITNGTRFACDRAGGGGSWCGPGWVTDRRPGQILPLPGQLGALRDLIDRIEFKWGQTRMLSNNLAVREDRGRNQWRNYIRDWNDTPSAPMANLGQGDNLGSDDPYTINFFRGLESIGIPGFSAKNPFACENDTDDEKCWGDPSKDREDSNRSKLPFKYMTKTSIWALNDDDDLSTRYRPGGLHFRLAYPVGGRMYPVADAPRPRSTLFPPNPQYTQLGLNQVEKTVIEVAGVDILKVPFYNANVVPTFDENHPWKGVVKFPHFEPGEYVNPCGQGLGSGGDPSVTNAATRREEFNQPSSWVMLNKTPPESLNPSADDTGAGTNKPALLNDSKALSITFNQPTKLQLDNTRKQFLLFDGLNAISRAQTYYHRPGNWAEQPNFFNPYWRPRLASVWQGRYSVPFINDVVNVLPGPMKALPPKIITH